MPKDTLWLGNKGNSFVLLHYGEVISEENLSLINETYNSNMAIYKNEECNTTYSFTCTSKIIHSYKVSYQTQFDKDVASYNKIGIGIQFILLGLFCYAIYSFI